MLDIIILRGRNSLEEVINRDASPSYGGFRYQKLRLAVALLQEIQKNPEARIVGAVEYKDDVYLLDKDGKEILEQDKNYTSSNFSFVSESITNSINSFLDQYILSDRDENLKFLFYTNTGIAKERQTKKLEEKGLEVLDESILKYLQKKDYNDKVIDFCSKIILDKYKEQYLEKKISGNTEEIEKFTKEDWIKFISKIEFIFEGKSASELEEEVLNEIKRCNKFYNLSNLGCEELIKSQILDLIDKSMTKQNLLQKIITSSDLKVIFFETSNIGNNKKTDPSCDAWEFIEKEDCRNLSDKIKNVCNSFNDRIIQRYGINIILAESELKKLDFEIQKSIKTRVFTIMGEFLEDIILKEQYTENELKLLIKDMKEFTKNKFRDLKKDYTYQLENESILENCVILLINECYYSFD